MKDKYKIVVKKGDSLVYADGGELSHLSDNEKEINDLITFLDRKRHALMTKLASIEDAIELEKFVKKPIIRKEDLEKVFCETKVFKGSEFKAGLLNSNFFLGERASKNEELTGSTVRLVSATDIYYAETLVVKKGDDIPFYHQVQTWSAPRFSDGILKCVLDLRPKGVYGSDFETNMLNDGEGHYGDNFKIRAKPVYDAVK